jgi:hypothetical protein
MHGIEKTIGSPYGSRFHISAEFCSRGPDAEHDHNYDAESATGHADPEHNHYDIAGSASSAKPDHGNNAHYHQVKAPPSEDDPADRLDHYNHRTPAVSEQLHDHDDHYHSSSAIVGLWVRGVPKPQHSSA